jgi:hypothetical protein
METAGSFTEIGLEPISVKDLQFCKEKWTPYPLTGPPVATLSVQLRIRRPVR